MGYVGQHSYNTIQSVNINALDFGAAFLPATQDPTAAPSATPGATSFAATNPDLLRSFRDYSTITQRFYNGWRTYHSIQISINRRFRDGFSFGVNDTIGLSDKQSIPARLQHDGLGSYSVRDDQNQAENLLGDNRPVKHFMKAHFARVRIVGDPGNGCGSDVYTQFNTAAFQGPLPGSVGLESATGVMRGCFQSALDLAIARNIRLPKGRTIQFRVDMFNAPNAAIITGRNASLTLSNPNDPVTAQNLPYDASGNLLPTRSLPKNAGFGVATTYQAPRNSQGQIRFSF